MSTSHPEDELAPETTPGFKVGEKKTLEQYQQLDQEDDAMRKWKESLGLAAGGDLIDDPKDPRTCIIESLGLEVEGRPDIIVNLKEPGALDKLKKSPFTIKEGAVFCMKVTFRVQREVLSGLKLVQVASRGPLSHKMQEMIGSYAPSTTKKPFYEKKFEPDTAPSGMIGRGTYKVVSKFVDDDKKTHLQWDWVFEVKKDWQ